MAFTLIRRLPETARLRRVCESACGWLVAVWLLVVLGGCRTATQSIEMQNTPAVVKIENHSDYAWRIAFQKSTEHGEPHWVDVKPRERQEIRMAAGRYRVHRQLVTMEDVPLDEGAERVFVGGRVYTWPLSTLFSQEGVLP